MVPGLTKTQFTYTNSMTYSLFKRQPLRVKKALKRRLSLAVWCCGFCMSMVMTMGRAQGALINHESKSSVVAQLQSIQKSQNQKLQEIDREIGRTVNSAQNLPVSGGGFNQIATQLHQLHSERTELQLRQRFLDRLIFQVDTYWAGHHLRRFLENKLSSMAKIEEKSVHGSSRMATFLTYLSVATRKLPEPGENVISFIQGYMDFSSLKNPKPPSAFLKTRDYTNGVANEKAHGWKIERAAEFADRKFYTPQIRIHGKLPRIQPQ